MNPQAAPPPYESRARLPTARPRWAYVFLVVNVIVFAGLELTGGSTNARNLVAWGANWAPLVAAGQYWRLVSANFLHIGAVHLLVNSYALYLLGTEVEALYGHPRFIAIYLLSGVSGAIFSFMLTQGLSAGASTSLFGLFGALGVFYYKHRGLLGSLGQQRLVSLGLTLLVNVFIGFSPGSGIDNWGHLGGLVGGVALAWFLCPKYALVAPFGWVQAPSAQERRPELSNGQIMDTNSLPKQAFNVGLVVIGLVLLTILATLLQRG